jgi:alpha-beta hydrolase superfamily lysophospholipase
VETQIASDGYPIHVAVWPGSGTLRGRVVVIHGVQSHGGWYQRLGRTLAEAGYETHFPDRRGSGANRADRGHAPSARRLVADLAEWLASLRALDPALPLVLAGISWGGKLAVITAAGHPELVDALALICPGLQPRVGVSAVERLRIAWAYFFNSRKTFPLPLSEPELFTASPEGQAFIAADRLGLHAGTAGLLAVSTFIDIRVRLCRRRVRQPILLMLAGHDRIVDNAKTRATVQSFASTDRTVIDYPEAHHTLEFEPDPTRYAHDLIDWIDRKAANRPTAPRVASSAEKSEGTSRVPSGGG